MSVKVMLLLESLGKDLLQAPRQLLLSAFSWLLAADLQSSHNILSVCISISVFEISLFYKDTNHTDLGITLMTPS